MGDLSATRSGRREKKGGAGAARVVGGKKGPDPGSGPYQRKTLRGGATAADGFAGPDPYQRVR